MNRPLVVGPIAERELVSAGRWYESRETGLGLAFIDDVLRAFDSARSRSRQYWERGK